MHDESEKEREEDREAVNTDCFDTHGPYPDRVDLTCATATNYITAYQI